MVAMVAGLVGDQSELWKKTLGVATQGKQRTFGNELRQTGTPTFLPWKQKVSKENLPQDDDAASDEWMMDVET